MYSRAIALVSLVCVLGIVFAVSMFAPDATPFSDSQIWGRDYFSRTLGESVAIEKEPDTSPYEPLPNFSLNVPGVAFTSSETSSSSSPVNEFLNYIDDVFAGTPYTLTKPVSQKDAPLVLYGNAVGDIVISVSSDTGTVAAALDTFISSPNSENAAELTQFAQTLRETSANISSVVPVPAGFEQAHASLAANYLTTAATLERLAETRTTDSALVKVEEYNQSVETLGSSFITMVQLFAAFSVVFDSQDSGSIFSPLNSL